MKKRSAYRPKPVNPNPLNPRAPAKPEDRARVMLTFLSSLDAMARGVNATPDEWRTLSDVINTLETLATTLRKVRQDELMPEVTAGIAAMVRATHRHKAGEGLRLDAEGVAAMRLLIGRYEECMDELSQYEMAEAQHATQRRVNALLKRPDHRVVSI